MTSQQAVLTELERQGGRPLTRRTAGKWGLRLFGRFTGNRMLREMVEMPYLVTEPVIMDDSAREGLIGPLHRTPYPEGIGLTLASVKPAY